MKKYGVALLLISIVFISAALIPNTCFAGVHVNIGVNIPLPRLFFPAPPAVVLIPGTYAYAVPDVDTDIVFYQGFWYRPHADRWFRAGSYNGPWKYIGHQHVPAAIVGLPPGYRHIAPGHQHIPYGHLKKNWHDWERHRYWDNNEYRHEEWERRHQERREQRHEERREQRHEERREHHEGGGGHHHGGGRDR
jgi:hypothetical protein